MLPLVCSSLSYAALLFYGGKFWHLFSPLFVSLLKMEDFKCGDAWPSEAEKVILVPLVGRRIRKILVIACVWQGADDYFHIQ